MLRALGQGNHLTHSQGTGSRTQVTLSHNFGIRDHGPHTIDVCDRHCTVHDATWVTWCNAGRRRGDGNGTVARRIVTMPLPQPSSSTSQGGDEDEEEAAANHGPEDDSDEDVTGKGQTINEAHRIGRWMNGAREWRERGGGDGSDEVRNDSAGRVDGCVGGIALRHRPARPTRSSWRRWRLGGLLVAYAALVGIPTGGLVVITKGQVRVDGAMDDEGLTGNDGMPRNKRSRRRPAASPPTETDEARPEGKSPCGKGDPSMPLGLPPPRQMDERAQRVRRPPPMEQSLGERVLERRREVRAGGRATWWSTCRRPAQGAGTLRGRQSPRVRGDRGLPEPGRCAAAEERE